MLLSGTGAIVVEKLFYTQMICNPMFLPTIFSHTDTPSDSQLYIFPNRL